MKIRNLLSPQTTTEIKRSSVFYDFVAFMVIDVSLSTTSTWFASSVVSWHYI